MKILLAEAAMPALKAVAACENTVGGSRRASLVKRLPLVRLLLAIAEGGSRRASLLLYSGIRS